MGSARLDDPVLYDAVIFEHLDSSKSAGALYGYSDGGEDLVSKFLRAAVVCRELVAVSDEFYCELWFSFHSRISAFQRTHFLES